MLSLQPVLRKLRKGHRRMGNEQGEMTSLVQEVVSGVRLVKSYRAEGREEGRGNHRRNARRTRALRMVQVRGRG